MRKAISLLMAFALGTGLAFADNDGLYVGGSVGYTSLEDVEGTFSYEDNPVGWKLIGGYKFTNFLAVEGAYANLGEASDNVLGLGDVNAEFSGFSATALGIIPLTVVDVFGKFGYYSGDLEVSALGVTGDESDSGVTAGAGVMFNLIPTLSFRGDIDWYDTDFDTLWSANVGLTFSF
ncbi:MAG: porin family protein [Pseudomonadota bacterium]